MQEEEPEASVPDPFAISSVPTPAPSYTPKPPGASAGSAKQLFFESSDDDDQEALMEVEMTESAPDPQPDREPSAPPPYQPPPSVDWSSVPEINPDEIDSIQLGREE